MVRSTNGRRRQLSRNPDDAVKRIKKLETIHSTHKKTREKSDDFAYWSFLALTLFMQFAMSLILVFLILVLQNVFLYVMAALLGVSFGWLYSTLLHGMRHTFIHHHVFAKVYIVVIAVISTIAVYSMSYNIGDIFGIVLYQKYIIGGIVLYYVMFLAPYFIHLLHKQIMQ